MTYFYALLFSPFSTCFILPHLFLLDFLLVLCTYILLCLNESTLCDCQAQSIISPYLPKALQVVVRIKETPSQCLTRLMYAFDETDAMMEVCEAARFDSM